MSAILVILGPAALLVAMAQPCPAQDISNPEVQHLGLYSHTFEDLGHPTAMAYGPDGSLWVADSDTGRILQFDSNNSPVKTSELEWLTFPGAAGMTVADDGNLWLSLPWQRSVIGLSPPSGFPAGFLTEPNPDTLRAGFLDPRGLISVDGNLWVVDAGWGRVDMFTKDGVWKKSIGENVLQGPQDVCMDSLGRLLVTDTGHSRVCIFSTDGELLGTFGEWGWFPGLFSDPTAIESHGERIYVADRENQRVQVFDLQGQPIYRIGMHAILPREGEGTLHYPTHLALRSDGKRLALAEPMDGRVQVFGMGPGEAPPKKINRPTDRQPAPHYGTHWDIGAGYLAIPEPETHSIRIYDLRGVEKPVPGKQAGTPTLVTEIGGFGTELGRYSQPGGLFIGGSPLTLLVCDTGNGRLVETGLDLSQEDPLGFTLVAARVHRALDLKSLNDTTEGFARPWTPRPIDVERANDGTTFVLCDLGREVYVLDSEWKLTARFDASKTLGGARPIALAWNEAQGRLYVCDESAGLVNIYDRKGQWLSSLGKGILQRPFAASFDGQGNTLVIDRQACAFLVFDAQGEFVRKQGFPGIDRYSFFGPTDVDVDERGRIYVLDHGNHRGMVFDAEGAWFHAFGSRLYTKPARLPETIKMSDEEDSK
jgi:DNA-binding beta-propeller fold protein YncE